MSHLVYKTMSHKKKWINNCEKVSLLIKSFVLDKKMYTESC